VQAGYDATLADLSGQLSTLQETILAESAEYHVAIEADKLQMEEELRKGEAERISEEALTGGADADTKLPFKQRMWKVELNKTEGNELVKDSNYGEGECHLGARSPAKDLLAHVATRHL
jgi:hypothetical protein